MTRTIGAEVFGLDLAQPVSDEEFKATVHDLIMRYMVVAFRDQHLTATEHVALARRLGDIYYYPAFPEHPQHPEIQVLSHTTYNNVWHRDSTHLAHPPDFIILNCLSAPEVGGDTLWANMVAAYELAPPLQHLVEELSAIHDHDFARAHVYKLSEPGGAEALSELRAAYPPVRHPLVHVHPVTGRKALYVDRGYSFELVGLPRGQSDALLELLQRHAESVDFQVRLRWRPGTVAIWDNRPTMHYGPCMDYTLAEPTRSSRLLHRITVFARPGT